MADHKGPKRCKTCGGFLQDNVHCVRCANKQPPQGLTRPDLFKGRRRSGTTWLISDEKHYLDNVGGWQLIPKQSREWYLRTYSACLALRDPRPPWADAADAYCRELIAKEFGG